VRKALITGLVIGLAALLAHARPNSPYEIKPSRNIGDEAFPNRSEYLLRFPERHISLREVTHYPSAGRFGRDEEGGIGLVVNTRLHEIHNEEIETWVFDLTGTGWDVTLIDVEGGSAQELKDVVIEQGGDGLVGVIFVGELPLAWFEQYEYFDDGDEPDNQRLEEYPIDLFFSDINGVWADNDSNGVYDSHTGDWSPELWLGRIAAYNLSRMDEDSLITGYLDRNHRYRQGELHLPHRALAFIDDDWISNAESWQRDEELAFGRVTLVAEAETTSATNYREELSGDGYDLVQVAVHSTADAHAFLINQRHEYDYFRFRNLREEVDPPVFFYNLFACSAMNLSGNLCMGSLYTLKGPYALGAVGSSKVGGMLYFDDFYRPLGEGVPIGESLRRWFVLHGQEEGHERWAQSWFYGMTCFGDPTLSITRGLTSERVTVDDRAGDGDGRSDAGEIFDLAISLRNNGLIDLSEIRATLGSLDTLVTVEQVERAYHDVFAGALSEPQLWSVSVARRAQDKHLAHLELEMTTENGEIWWAPISLTINAPVVRIGEFEIASEASDSSFAGPGESGRSILSLLNLGGHDAHGEQIEFRSLDSIATIHSDVDSIGRIAPGERGFAGFSYSISDQASASDVALVEFRAVEFGAENGRGVIALPLSVQSHFSDDLNSSSEWMVHAPAKEGYPDVWRWAEDAGEGSGGFAFGGPDSSFYPAQADGVLELPSMMLANGAKLNIRHRLNAEEQYDAATIEVNHGAGWTRVEPEGGYNGVSVPNGSFTGGACWNGSFDWRTDEVPLNTQDGLVQVRLRFSSDEGVEDIGWRIDRLEVIGEPLIVESAPTLPASHTLVQVYPNPFNSTLTVQITGALPERMALYDLTGRLVRRIVTPGDNAHHANGVKTISITEHDLSAGVYYLRWENGASQGTLKTALVK